MSTYGENKATDRKNIKALLTAITLVPLFASVCGEKNNSEVKSAMKALGLAGFFEATSDVLRTQVSNLRGRPALEEQPIHTMLKAMRECSKLANEEGVIDEAKANRIISRAVKVAERQQAQLQARRALFKPSKRIQGTRRLPVLVAGEEAKA